MEENNKSRCITTWATGMTPHCNHSTNISQLSPYFPPGLLQYCSETCVVLTFQYIVMFTVNFHSLISTFDLLGCATKQGVLLLGTLRYFPTIPIFSTGPSAALFRDLCRADFSVYRDVYCEFSLSHCSKLLCRSHVGAWRETYGFDTLHWHLTFLGLINPLLFICLFVWYGVRAL